MPFKKEKSRKTSSTGRPLKDPDEPSIASKSAEELREYQRKAKQKERGSVTPQKKEEGESSTKVGRPALSDQAMTPNSLKQYKRTNISEKRKQKKLSQTRSNAMKRRWQMRLIDPDERAPVDDIDEGVNPMVDNSDNEEESEEGSERTLYRSKTALIGLLTNSVFENLDVFVYLVRGKFSEIFDTSRYEQKSNLTHHQIRYRAEKIFDSVFRRKVDSSILLKYWLDKLMEHKLVEVIFDEMEWLVPDEIMPLSFAVSRTAKTFASKMLTRNNTSDERRRVGTLYVIEVAKACRLSLERHGSVELLARNTCCSRPFARKVLEAIEADTTDDLLKRNMRCDSIHANKEWIEKLSEFVLRPEYSRPVPGGETVSVRYGVRKPKFILRKTRMVIASYFKELYPDCPFDCTTLVREFPQNAVTRSTRDTQRNSCPYHCNARRIITALHSKDVALDVSSSCRKMVQPLMCIQEGIDMDDVLQWNEDCAFNTCKLCPKPEITLDDAVKDNPITYSQWTYYIDEKKKEKQLKKNPKKKSPGRTFGLVSKTVTIESAVRDLEQQLPKLKEHIYTAYSQWNAHKVNRIALDDSSVITVEDYQQNIEVEYIEKPTSLAYSTNKLAVALYPVCVEYKVS